MSYRVSILVGLLELYDEEDWAHTATWRSRDGVATKLIERGDLDGNERVPASPAAARRAKRLGKGTGGTINGPKERLRRALHDYEKAGFLTRLYSRDRHWLTITDRGLAEEHLRDCRRRVLEAMLNR